MTTSLVAPFPSSIVVNIRRLTRSRRKSPAPVADSQSVPQAVRRPLVTEVSTRGFQRSPVVASIDAINLAPEWLRSTSSLPEELSNDSFQTRALSRRLYLNIPMVRSWADAIMENTLEPRFPTLEWADTAPAALVEGLRQEWETFLVSKVVDGGLTGAEFCKSLLRQTMIDGDIFWTTSVNRGKLYFHPIEADFIDSSRSNTSVFDSIYTFMERGRARRGNPVKGGIEFSKDTGQPVRYHFTRPSKIILPAAEVVHVRKPLVSGWPRGLPWGRAAFNTLVRLESFAGAEMERQINSARLYFFTTSEAPNHPTPRQFGKTAGDNSLPPPPLPPTKDSIASQTNPALKLSRNTILQLDPGTKLETLNELGNKISPIPYIEILQTDAASGLGLSLPLLLRDYNKTNFSSGRLASESDKLYFQSTRDWIKTDIFYPILAALYANAVANGRLTSRDGVSEAEEALLLRPSVRWPSWPTTEPHREIPALEVAHRAGAISLQDMISRILPHARVEDVFAKIAAERELAKQYGIEDVVGIYGEVLAAEADRQVEISAAEDAERERASNSEPEGQGRKAQNPPTT